MADGVVLISSVPALVSAYLCAYGPGRGWWDGRQSAIPVMFARLALSLAWTTILGVVLAAFEAFSLPRIIAINGLITLAGYLTRRRQSGQTAVAHTRDRTGPLLFALCLASTWPAYAPFIGGADSTAYLATGIHLARSHRLWKHDPVVEELAPMLRRRVFPSALGRPWKPPYSRMLGGMVIDSPDSSTVHPSFFPAPIIWAAIFADALGARWAGGFAPMFAALAVWGAWLIARRRLPGWAAAVSVALIAFNAGGYWAARMPLAEPLAWAFLWAGLVALDGWRREGRPVDGWVSGLLLGATGLARVEYFGFVAIGLAAWALLALPREKLLRTFFPLVCGFAVMAVGTVVQARLLPGAYLAPITEVWSGLVYHTARIRNTTPWLLIAVPVGLGMCGWLASRLLGLPRVLLLTAVAGPVGLYTFFSSMRFDRSLAWLSAYLGWPTLILSLAGFWTLWNQRNREGANGFFVALSILAGGLLLYNTHVWPELPWAARRFVPLVFPAVILAACAGATWVAGVLASAARRVWQAHASPSCNADHTDSPHATDTPRRSGLPAGRARATLLAGGLGLASAGVWIVLIASVGMPARGIWGKPFYRNSYEQLTDIATRIPRDATVLLDSRLARFVLGTPLWLLHERNSVPVYAGSRQGRAMIAGLVASLDGRGPVVLLEPTATTGPEPIPFVRKDKSFDYTLDLILPGALTAPSPKWTLRYYFHLSAFDLRRVRLPRRPSTQ